MRLKITAIAAAAATTGLIAGAAQASTFVNGSFEATLNGWTMSDAALASKPMIFNHDNGDGTFNPYTPRDGWALAVMTAGAGEVDVTMSQTFTTTGGTFSGWLAFSFGDLAPNYDSASLKLFGGDPDPLDLFLSDAATLGSMGDTGWRFFSRTLGAGTYTITATVRNFGDDIAPSFLLLDGFAMAEAPEPATWTLMLAGFGLAGAALRRRRPLAL